MFRWLKHRFLWLTRDAAILWAMVLPLALAVWVGVQLPRTRTPAIILAGFLQLAGLVITFIGLQGSAKKYGLCVAEPFTTWWRKSRLLKNVSATFTMSIESDAALALKIQRAGPKPGTPEERIVWLETQVTTIHTQNDILRDAIDQAKTTSANSLS